MSHININDIEDVEAYDDEIIEQRYNDSNEHKIHKMRKSEYTNCPPHKRMSKAKAKTRWRNENEYDE